MKYSLPSNTVLSLAAALTIAFSIGCAGDPEHLAFSTESRVDLAGSDELSDALQRVDVMLEQNPYDVVAATRKMLILRAMGNINGEKAARKDLQKLGQILTRFTQITEYSSLKFESHLVIGMFDELRNIDPDFPGLRRLEQELAALIAANKEQSNFSSLLQYWTEHSAETPFIKRLKTEFTNHSSFTLRSQQDVTKEAMAATIEQTGPKVCASNYHSAEAPTWGPAALCNSSSAVVGSGSRVGNDSWTKHQIAISPSCCRLPRHDILLDDFGYYESTCPNNFVATGRVTVCKPDEYSLPNHTRWEVCRRPIRCTGINTKRYRLGPRTPGLHWGSLNRVSANMQMIPLPVWLSHRVPGLLMSRDLPLSARYGLRRVGRFTFGSDGCVGQPVGSLLTDKSGRQCNELGFRELQYRGIGNDPPNGTPVKMFPDCAELTNVSNIVVSCVRPQ